jgi:hypothetical protein
LAGDLEAALNKLPVVGSVSLPTAASGKGIKRVYEGHASAFLVIRAFLEISVGSTNL